MPPFRTLLLVHHFGKLSQANLLLQLRTSFTTTRINHNQVELIHTSTFNSSQTESDASYGIEKFYDPKVQSYLKELTGRNFGTVFRKKKIGQKLREPKVSFMTESQLEKSIKEAEEKAEHLLQMPPVLPPRKEEERILSFDPYIQGHDPDNSTIMLTDITLNGNDRDRIIVARDPDGTLRHANWNERIKLNNAYFPTPAREIRAPKLFTDIELLKSALEKANPTDNVYEYVLDRACLQFEPDDPLYISAVECTYSVIDVKGHYDYLSSTRHFGPLVFYLIRKRKMDNLLMHYIKTERLSPHASILVSLFHLIFTGSSSSTSQNIIDSEDGEIKKIRSYIELDSLKKSELELTLNSYLERRDNKDLVEHNLERAHGL